MTHRFGGCWSGLCRACSYSFFGHARTELATVIFDTRRRLHPKPGGASIPNPKIVAQITLPEERSARVFSIVRTPPQQSILVDRSALSLTSRQRNLIAIRLLQRCCWRMRALGRHSELEPSGGVGGYSNR